MNYNAGLVAGLGNIVGRGPYAVLASSEDADRPLPRLYDGSADLPFRFDDEDDDQTITVDGSLVTYGDFEQQNLAGWTEDKSGAGSATATTAVTGEFHGGTRALKCTAGAGYASRYQEIIARAGEPLILDGFGRAVTAGNYKIRVQRRSGAGAGMYLTSGGIWAVGVQDAGSGTSTSYEHVCNGLAFNVEDFDTCQQPLVVLRLTAYCDSGIACFDDLHIWPQWNGAALFGHNIDRVVELHSSSDGFASNDTTEAILSVRNPGFYGLLAAPITKRWSRISLPGTPYAQTYLGELVIGYFAEARRGARFGFTAGQRFPQVRSAAPSGAESVYQVTTQYLQDLDLDFISTETADFAELLEEWFVRTGGGADPMVVILDDTDPRSLVGGRLEADFNAQRQMASQGVWTTPARIRGWGMPVVGL
jgi:hypothetical protein